VRRIDLFYDKVIFFSFFYYDNVSTVSHKPFHKLKRILIYSKRGSSCGNPITEKQISYTVAYLAIPLLIINNNGDVIDFPRRFLMTSVLSFTRENKRK
jgi:hypothetical protein